MTRTEIELIKNEILEQIMLEGRLIGDLVPEPQPKDGDLVELDGGRYATLRDIATATGTDVVGLAKRFLSKVNPDIAQGLITFAAGLIAEEIVKANAGAHFGEFVSGISTGKGGAVDSKGNAEVESLVVRTYLKVLELLINRLTAVEGDQILTEGDTIERIVDNGDGTYGLFLREKWDGYFTAMTQGAVIKGIYNTLDKGSGDYYTSWMRVNSVNTSANYIEVSMYPDDEVPSGKNFLPVEQMNIARWGHQTDKSRQSLFYISSAEGRIIKLARVTRPIIERGNHEAVFGTFPDWVYEMEGCKSLPKGSSGIVADKIVTTQVISVDRWGLPIPTYVDRGIWDEAVADTEAGGEGYFGGGYNPLTGNYEISDVYHLGCKWRCCKDGTKTPPRWDTTDWAFLEGNPDFTVEFAPVCTTSTVEGLDITLTIVGRLHNQDVTADIRDSDIEWTRYSEDSRGNPRPLSDNAWAISHAGAGKSVRITKGDLDYDGTIPRVIRFTATATLRDGTTTASAQMDMTQV